MKEGITQRRTKETGEEEISFIANDINVDSENNNNALMGENVSDKTLKLRVASKSLIEKVSTFQPAITLAKEPQCSDAVQS